MTGVDEQARYWDAQAAGFDQEPDHGLRDPATRAAWAELLRRVIPARRCRVADLGCGTGTLAVLLAEEGHDVTGVDVSPKMIEQARATGLYAGLEVADMVAGLRSKADASANLILAADAMVYVSDLAPLLREVFRVLMPGGLLAFTTETHRGEGVTLGDGLRYAHGAAYVREAIKSAGLTLAHFDGLSARNEDNAPVPGLVVVATKT